MNALSSNAFTIGTHYSLSQNPSALNAWADRAASMLPDHLDGRYPVFVYRGMSGVAAATALALAYDRQHGASFGMIYVRKPNENSHGYDCEVQVDTVRDAPCLLVFVDDFVSTGHTMRAAMEEAFTVNKLSLDMDFPRYMILTTKDGVDMRYDGPNLTA